MILFLHSRIRIKDKIHGNTLALADTPGLLDCHERRRFWVSWANKTISVGAGELFAST